MVRRSCSRRGFTILDVFFAAAIVVLLSGFTALLAADANETARRVKCASNLRQIGQAILLYSNENRGAYPRAKYDPALADKPVAFTNPHPQLDDQEKQDKADPSFCKAGPGPNDVTAALFLLLRTEDISPEVFICPSVAAATTEPAAAPDAKADVNFTDPRQLSYSYCNPYPNEAAADAGYKADNALAAQFAIVADINPGVDELLTVTSKSDDDVMRKVNSPNHGGEAQNVLFADGHVELQNNPFCGKDRDNIYTFGKSGETSGGEGIVGSPTSDGDSVLLPTARAAEKK